MTEIKNVSKLTTLTKIYELKHQPFCDFKIAKAYGIQSMKIKNHSNMREMIKEAIYSEGLIIVDVVLDPMELFLPKVVSERKLDGQMASKLGRYVGSLVIHVACTFSLFRRIRLW